MKVLVIGAGMMGSAMAYDLAHSSGVETITLADINEERAYSIASAIGRNIVPRKLDTNDFNEVVRLMKTVNVAIGATTYTQNLSLTKAAIEAGIHFCDLGGNMDVVDSQIELHARARAANICILPNCGLAPGMACVVAAGSAKKFSSVDEIHIRVGGLPQHPQPPLHYQLVFSAEGLINEYLEPAEVIHNSTLKHVDSMIDVEELEFPPPFGKLEAFNTSGGVSMLTRIFKGTIKELDYKTIRYKGHCEKFKTLLDLGFASTEPIMVGNSVRTTREVFEELLRRKLPTNGPDVVLMRVTVIGTLQGTRKTLAYEMIDYYDEKGKMTSMMRTTAFPTSIIAQMVANGTITARGVVPPEQCVPLDPLIEELKKRSIIIKEKIW
ncbi:MAG: saccharopine dehydrogenase NADP-binding domain-containing protein [Ignavibacteria bacterium]|nr:saccharopine dehydrogenase NADP-binding domain-containing protein [Ignavibacteria bacterium]MBI3765997.1 saccharopine dehydrogenase NADP-binding domain-containing protein [Ignavibacteriales bacterium]